MAAGKKVGAMSSKHAMIKRGKEEADALNNYLPIFQKRIKDPQRLSGAMKATTKFDYTKSRT